MKTSEPPIPPYAANSLGEVVEIIVREMKAALRDYNEQVLNSGRPMKVTEFAERMGISRWKVYDLIRRGKLRRISGLIPESEWRKFGL